MDDKFILKALEKIGAETVAKFKSEMQSHDFSMTTSKSVRYYVKNDQQLMLEFADTAKYVDRGTRPHMPPVNKIKKWANAHGINEWALAYHIKKYGTAAHPFLNKVYDVMSAGLKYLNEAYANKIEADMDKFFASLNLKVQ